VHRTGLVQRSRVVRTELVRIKPRECKLAGGELMRSVAGAAIDRRRGMDGNFCRCGAILVGGRRSC